jgi:DNA mismatch repair protein MutS
MDGPADKSYGIHVAKIAGMPTELLSRAATILSALEADAPIQKQPEVIEENEQLSLFNEVSTAELGVVDSLKKANLLEMNPMEALNFLYELQKRI